MLYINLFFQIFVGILNSFLVSVVGWVQQAGHQEAVDQEGYIS